MVDSFISQAGPPAVERKFPRTINMSNKSLHVLRLRIQRCPTPSGMFFSPSWVQRAYFLLIMTLALSLLPRTGRRLKKTRSQYNVLPGRAYPCSLIWSVLQHYVILVSVLFVDAVIFVYSIPPQLLPCPAAHGWRGICSSLRRRGVLIGGEICRLVVCLS